MRNKNSLSFYLVKQRFVGVGAPRFFENIITKFSKYLPGSEQVSL